MMNLKKRKLIKLLSFILCMTLVLCENSWGGMGTVSAAEAGNPASMASIAVTDNTGDTDNAVDTESTTDTDNTVDTGSTAVYYGNGYSVTVEISAKWNNGYNANVTIENTSDKEIRNWELIMTGANPVSNIWNARILSQEDNSLKIGNCGWNQDIAPGSSVSFGFQSLTENASMPAECYLAGDRQDAADEDYQIVFRAVNIWEGGCVVETDILNLTDKDIEDWDIAFTWKNIRIADIWNAVIDTENDGNYSITNDTYNSTVPANGKVTFGMRLETGAGELIFPTDARLSRWTGDGNASDDDNADEPADEELRRWNRTMMNMDTDIVQEAVNKVDEPIKVAILDSGVDAMPEIPVVERFNLIDGEDEMTEMYEDGTGHGTAVASVMAYHREKEEEPEEGTENTYTYDGYTYEYFTDDIEDYEEYFDLGETEEDGMGSTDEEDSDMEGQENGTGSADMEDSTDGTDDNDGEWDDYEDDEDYEEDEEDGENPEGTIRLGEFVEEHQADFEGINPNMELYSVRLLDDMNEASVSDVIKGIRWAMENDIKIINISFGTKTDSPELHKVIKEAEKKGILIIAAAGNSGEIQYPAAYEEVIAVGSVDYTGKVDRDCETDTYVELTAPGEGVLAVGPFGVETEAGGTSIAAGEVSAVASILWQHDPTVSNRFLRQLLRAGANKSDNTAMDYGIVDCEYSLSIFDDLKATFVDNGETATEELMEEAGIEENTDELGTEGIVTANWNKDGHLGMIPDGVSNVTGKYLRALKIGIRLQDRPFCNLNDKGIYPAFHGNYKKVRDKNAKDNEVKYKEALTSFNYVSGYLYLSRLAGCMLSPGYEKDHEGKNYSIEDKDYWNNTFTDLKMEGIISSKGVNVDGKKLEENKEKEDKKGITFPDSTWENILKKEEPSILEKSLVVYGMSLHTMSDTFAHSCKGHLCNGSQDSDPWVWVNFSKLAYEGKIDGLSANDNPLVCPQRYWHARQAVLNSMDRIKIDTVAGTMTIEKTKTIDFCSRARYLEIRKKIAREDINKKFYLYANIQYIRKKAASIMLNYYSQGFGICNIREHVADCKRCGKCDKCDNEKECEIKKPDNYFKEIDINMIKRKSRKCSVVKLKTFMDGAKDDTGVSVDVIVRNRRTRKSKRILGAKGTQNGTFCCALDNSIIKNPDMEYVVERSISGQKTETIINSETPFKETNETDEDTVVLMETWDIDGNIQGPNQMKLTGLVVEAKENGGYGNAINGAKVTVQYDNGGNEPKSKTTGSDGRYNMGDLAPGLYKLTVTKEGYLTATQYLYLNGMSAQYQNMTIALIKEPCAKGDVTGTIRDSVSLNGVEGLTLNLRKGFNNTGCGKALRSTSTASQGKYSFTNLPAGYYCIEIFDEEERYIDTYLNVFVTEKSGETSQDGIVSGILQKEQMRIVLTWDNSVSDLDSHMEGSSEYFHVCFWNKKAVNSRGELLAELDVDDVSYYGPETITVHDPNVSFKYYVHNYSGGGSNVLSNSNAAVHVYMGNRLTGVYHVPLGTGRYWDVFSYDGKTGLITPLMNVLLEK